LLEKDKEAILKENNFLNIRKNKLKKSRFEKSKQTFFIVGIILSIITLIVFYFLTSFSNIKDIIVISNNYLKEDYIKEISGLSLDDKFIIVNTKKIEDKIKKNDFIKDCVIEKIENNSIEIKVIEKKIIGYTNLDSVDYFLFEDLSKTIINENNLYLINDVPLIEGYDEDALEDIVKGLSKVDSSILFEISEIHKYAFSYDSNMMEVIMHDGNYVFSSAIGFKLLDMTSYYTVIADVSSSDKICLYLDEVTGTLQYRGCPWEKRITNDDNNA